MQKRHRTISSSVATVAAGSFSNSTKRRIGSFAGLLAGRRGKKLEPVDAGNRVFCQRCQCGRGLMLPPHSHFVSPRTKRRTMGAPESGRSNARSAPRSGRWALLRMRNAKPAAKDSCLYDHAVTSISRARSSSAGWCFLIVRTCGLVPADCWSSFTGLSVEQSKILTEKAHVYLTTNGRISMAGLNRQNIRYFCGESRQGSSRAALEIIRCAARKLEFSVNDVIVCLFRTMSWVWALFDQNILWTTTLLFFWSVATRTLFRSLSCVLSTRHRPALPHKLCTARRRSFILTARLAGLSNLNFPEKASPFSCLVFVPLSGLAAVISAIQRVQATT